MTKNIDTPQLEVLTDDNRPEPFATVPEVVSERRVHALIWAITANEDFEFDDDKGGCGECRRRTARLFWELEQLDRQEVEP
jgi:hypothetical protein